MKTPDLQGVGAELIAYLQDAVPRGAAFLEREAPALASEVILWGVVRGVLALAYVLCVAAVAIAVARTARTFYTPATQDSSIRDRETRAVYNSLTIALGAAVFMLFSSLGLPFVIDGVRAAVAPRLYLVEYLAKAVR